MSSTQRERRRESSGGRAGCAGRVGRRRGNAHRTRKGRARRQRPDAGAASPARARLNASVLCVTGSSATKSRAAAARRRRGNGTRGRPRASCAMPVVRDRERRRAAPSGEHVVERRGRASARGGVEAPRRRYGERRTGNCVASFCQTPSARSAAVVAASPGKNGCQPRPNGNASRARVFERQCRVRTRRATVAPCSRRELERLRRAKRPRPRSRASPRASCASTSRARIAAAPRRSTMRAASRRRGSHADASPKLRSSAYSRPPNGQPRVADAVRPGHQRIARREPHVASRSPVPASAAGPARLAT